ncbi:hypothetical protein ACG33_03090 [Steroidobacter denitrificans]|uniref:Polysaccharide biosynthesis protein GumN n=1 Tax=Steroidobacter denitrificans TaxID=465721 RepID=A0A127F934_STEDE|nr:TraB/GumN family protein [Steroidobacter denitrificans]AMN46110.1 hypothetical protein ACG33_03090 [Steroidobacter denitrificans]
MKVADLCATLVFLWLLAAIPMPRGAMAHPALPMPAPEVTMRIATFPHHALAHASAPAASRHAEHEPQHTLWSVKGRRNTLYLLGSIHFLPPDEPLPAAIEAAYAQADRLVMEIDIGNLDLQDMQQSLLELGLLPPGRSLEQQLGPQAHAAVATAARELELDPALLNPLRPWLAAMTLIQQHFARRGLESRAGIEQRLAARARRDQKPVTGLETLRQQLSYLANLPETLQIEFLMYSVADFERMDRDLDELLSAWRQGDIQTLERLLAEGFAAYPELYRPLTIERNHRWVTDIEALLEDEQDYLVIVGALHLVGPESVVALLRSRGHVLQRH